MTIIGLGMVVITSCDLDPAAAVAAAAGLFPRQQLRDSQPGWCVSAAAVPGLDRSKKRGERVKTLGPPHFPFPVPSNNVADIHFPVY